MLTIVAQHADRLGQLAPKFDRSLRMRHIFHPTDLGSGGSAAFLHALRLAAALRASLTIMHVDDEGDRDASSLPGVRRALARWGYLKDANDVDGLKALGMGVRKVVAEGGSPVRSCLRHLEKHPTDLIVLATHQEQGLAAWSNRRVAEPLSRGSGEPTLFIPEGRPGFVDAATGGVSIRKVLIPIARDPGPQRAVDMISTLADALGQRAVTFVLLHVGTPDTRPGVALPVREGWTSREVTVPGDPVDVIVHEAADADLVVMTTKGHDGFLDILRGSTTERVMRGVRCPVLAVPAR